MSIGNRLTTNGKSEQQDAQKFRLPGPDRQKLEALYLTISLLAIGGILYAGLKPFHSPTNEVTWSEQFNALRFGQHGTAFTTTSFPEAGDGDAGRTVEMWIEPALPRASGTILAFYDPRGPRNMSLKQSINDLELRIGPSNAWNDANTIRIYADNSLFQKQTAFWSITSGPSGVAIYRNGIPVRSSGSLRISSREFSGRVVIGNSPISNESWSGITRGLAIYNRELTPDAIHRHYVTWGANTIPKVAPDDLCIALYSFDEHAGPIAHNRVSSAGDLTIPRKYVVLSPTILNPVWRALNWNRGYWEDALINLIGFIPAGFFWCACFSIRGFDKPIMLAAILAGVISLFVELAQVHLPTRDSSMSDLITNLAGGALGAWIYRIVEASCDRAVYGSLFFDRP